MSKILSMINYKNKIRTYISTLRILLKGADKGVHNHFHAIKASISKLI